MANATGPLGPQDMHSIIEESTGAFNAAEAMGVPAQLLGGDRPASIEGKKFLHSSPSENRTYIGGEVMRFSLPTMPNSYVMPDVQLKFGVTNQVAAAGAVFTLDGGANALISRLRIFHGSQLLEDIQDYNRLRQIVCDVSQSPINSSTLSSVLEGTPQSNEHDPVAVAAIDIITQSSRLKVVPRQWPADFVGAQRNVYSVSILSGLIGSLAKKALPVTAMTASNVRVELTLAANNDAMITTAAGNALVPTWIIDNAELRSTYVQISETAQALIHQAVGGHYVCNSSTYSHAQSNILGADSNANILLPFSYSSATNLIHGVYNTANNGLRTNYTITGRSKANINDVHWQIGAARVPSTPLQGTTDVISETCKCFGVSSDLLQVSNHFTKANCEVVTSALVAQAGAGHIAANAVNEQGRFTMGLDLQTFGSTSSADRVENGANTTASQLFLSLTTTAGTTFNNGVAGVVSYEVHSWCQYDVLYQCQNGTMYARF